MTGSPLTMPRVSLALLPTPIEPLPRLSAHLGGPALFIKRDDQTGLATGGNKARKLEYLMAQALEAGAESVITAGSTQSNHARQTAAAAARHGLACHLVLHSRNGYPPGQPSTFQGNLLLNQVLGARLYWTTETAPYQQTLETVAADLRASGRKPYIIPYGGSNAHGLLGYVSAWQEVLEQDSVFGPFDTHIFASSSGGTHAGLLLGQQLFGSHARLIGISVDRPADVLARKVAQLANEGAALVGSHWRISPPQIEISDAYLGGGYAVIGHAEREAIRLLARLEGILVDPVYSGRALAGLIDLARRGAFTTRQRVLFWHTGGVPALFGFSQQLGLEMH